MISKHQKVSSFKSFDLEKHPKPGSFSRSYQRPPYLADLPQGLQEVEKTLDIAAKEEGALPLSQGEKEKLEWKGSLLNQRKGNSPLS